MELVNIPTIGATRPRASAQSRMPHPSTVVTEPPSLDKAPGTIITGENAGIYYQNVHNDLRFIKVSDFQKIDDGFLKSLRDLCPRDAVGNRIRDHIQKTLTQRQPYHQRRG